MAQALTDVTNQPVTAEPIEQVQTSHGLSWVKPQPYNYESATAQGASGTADGEPTWAHKFARYEWKDEYGDVGPEIPELEQELFHNEYTSRRGIKFEEYGYIVKSS